ncbi:thioredoxin domain-containing protein [Rhodoferax sp.]|uniref:DsbA family protein n=1 Tax=Rhodoferax sp. TaxID=50421 RepID=UPI00276116BB|nr:thioredoxin domain-containing protein [Rhodoferax sp.]
MSRKLMVVLAALLALAVFLIAAIVYDRQGKQAVAQSAQDHRAALVRPDAAVYGNPDAKVSIVEFLDPACEACRAFYPLVKGLVNASFGRVNLVLRYAAFHQGSDQAVKILEAARKQPEMYWPVLEIMLKTQPQWASHDHPQPAMLWQLIGETGVDVARAKLDANDPAIQKRLDQDMADVLTLKISKTPSFFVNGKPLLEFGAEQLKRLVEAEVRSAYPK